jgi:nucleoid-associated protein YgaU
MKKINKFLLIMIITLGLGFYQLNAAVSLSSKISYMEKLKKEAETFKNQGYYDKSIEKSKEVKTLSLEIDYLITIIKKWYQLERNIAVAKQIGADKIALEEYNKAVDFYKLAEKNFVDENNDQANFNIDEGLKYIDIAINKTKEYLENNPQLGLKKNEIVPKLEIIKVDDKYYVVKLIPQRRDSLWRIAEYDFIYDNARLWPRIYEANRDIINDPDLIYPDQKLIIPPLPLDLDK